MRQNESRKRLLERVDRSIRYIEMVMAHTKAPEEITAEAVGIVHDLSRLYDKLEQWDAEVPRLPNRESKLVLFPDGVTYPSIKAAAEAHKISWATAATCIKENRLPLPRGNPHGIPITIDGVTYPTHRAAERALDLPPGKLYT